MQLNIVHLFKWISIPLRKRWMKSSTCFLKGRSLLRSCLTSSSSFCELLWVWEGDWGATLLTLSKFPTIFLYPQRPLLIFPMRFLSYWHPSFWFLFCDHCSYFLASSQPQYCFPCHLSNFNWKQLKLFDSKSPGGLLALTKELHFAQCSPSFQWQIHWMTCLFWSKEENIYGFVPSFLHPLL